MRLDTPGRMRIDAARLHVIPLRLRAPFGDARGSTDARPTILLELRSGGWRGVSECPALTVARPGVEDHATALAALRDVLLPAVIGDASWGEGPEAAGPAPDDLRALAPDTPMAVSAVRMVFEDLAARAAGQSLADWLAARGAARGARQSARAGAPARAVIGLPAGPEEALAAAAGLVEAGYRRLKLKVTPDRGLDAARAIRAAHPDVALAADGNGSFAHALDALRDLDGLGLEFIEQPLAPSDIGGHAALRRSCATPIGLDESVASPPAAREAVEARAADALNIRPALCGGHLEALRILELCREAGVGAWCGGYLEAGVGRAHAVAFARQPGVTLGADLSASVRYWERDVTTSAARLDAAGALRSGNGPGAGVSIDREAVRGLGGATLEVGR